MKAAVFDNSGTLLERYRVIKDIENNQLITDINSIDLIESSNDLALVVLQFNTNCLSKLDPETLISTVIIDNNIDFNLSYSSCSVTNNEIYEVIKNDKSTISEITDGFDLLKSKIPNMELCNGSALILDMKKSTIAYTITSAGKLFPEVLSTIDILKNRGIEIFIASGDRSGAIQKLANILDINPKNAFSTASTARKSQIVKSLQDQDYKVMMVGDDLNDLLAFKQADVSVLTLEQKDKIPPKLINQTDYVINNISEIINLDF